jgi:type II secretory pathway pseudopilin PulG
MATLMHRCRSWTGFSLLETLIATLVLSIGIVGLMRFQAVLRSSGDLARQRIQAARLASHELERLRSAWGTTQPTNTTTTLLQSDTRYEQIGSLAAWGTGTGLSHLTHAQVRLNWSPAQSGPQNLALNTLLNEMPADVPGSLLLAPDIAPWNGPSADQPLKRHPSIPLQAKDLGDGSIAFKPRIDGALVWLFDARSGLVTSRCNSDPSLNNSQLTRSSLSGCTLISGFLLAGYVRFATNSDNPNAADVANPPSPALDLDMQLSLTSTGHPNPAVECLDDAPAVVNPAQTIVSYSCLVQPAGNPARWSGRLNVLARGWSLRICRYSQDRNGNGRIDNAEHPQSYTDVSSSLADQNFLVVRAATLCPAYNLSPDPSGVLPPLPLVTQPHQP